MCTVDHTALLCFTRKFVLKNFYQVLFNQFKNVLKCDQLLLKRKSELYLGFMHLYNMWGSPVIGDSEQLHR